jgi:hypothetical protein
MRRNDWTNDIFNSLSEPYRPIVSIENNKNATISNININFLMTPTEVLLPSPRSLRNDFHELTAQNSIIEGILEKEICLVSKLESFKYITVKNNLQPIIRQRALFSTFSTLRQSSNTDDLSVLELQEKRILLELAKRGCIFRIILNLDFLKAKIGGYSNEDIAIRIGDLCNVCDDLSDDKNFQVAIAPYENYEPIWTLDDILIHKQIKWEAKANYSSSYWDSDYSAISAFNNRFDQEYNHVMSQMTAIWKVLHISSLPEYILYLARDFYNHSF